MQGLIIHSSTGEALSSEEITDAHRVADTHKEMRAGVIRQVDVLTGATVEYYAHKRMALTTPGTGFDYVKMRLPNPVPYRGVSIGVVSGASVIGPSISYLSSSGSSVPGFYGSEEASGTASYSFSAGGQTFTSTGSYSYSYSGWVGYGFPPQTAFTTTTSYSNYPVFGLGVANGSSTSSRTSDSGPISHSGSITYTPFSETALYAQVAASVDTHDYTYVVASNGEVLAREAQTLVPLNGGYVDFFPGSLLWNGGGSCDMFRQPVLSADNWQYSHKLTFDVPDDCIYPPSIILQPYPGLNSVISVTTAYGGQAGAMTSHVVISGPGGTFAINGSANQESTGDEQSPNYTITYTNENYFILPNFVSGVRTETYTAGFLSGSTSSITNTLWYATPEYYAASQAPADIVRWEADWADGQADLKLRRKLWFKKNHDTVLAQLKNGAFTLPVTWDYAIKRNAPVSGHTYRPILMDVTYEDSDPVVVETFPVITTTIARETTFSYTIDVIQPDGSVVTEERSLVLVGSKKTVTTESYIAVTDRTLTWDRFNFQNWYVPSTDPSPGSAYENFYKHRLLRDKSQYGLGLIWSGEDMASPWLADSLYGYPANPLDFVGFTPPIPTFSNTLVGTVPQFVLDYRHDVPIQYNKDGPGDTAWNDSAMVDKETITIVPFSPVKKGESLGMFWDSSSLDPDNTGTKTFDSLLIFGSAQFHYVYETGEIFFDKWIPLIDADGNEVETRKVSVAGTEPESNCIVKYGKLIWPDVIKAGKEHMKKLASGEVEDPEEAILMKAIIDAAKSA